MIRNMLAALLSGTLFGAGLAVSGMADPARVRGFLDVFGRWDPTLAFVMGGAVVVMAAAWMLKSKMRKPIFAAAFAVLPTRLVDARLIAAPRSSASAGASPVYVPARRSPISRSIPARP